MNKNRPTSNRIKWTTLALNYFLDLYREIMGLTITKHERETAKAKGTMEDADIIFAWILEQVGSEPADLLEHHLFKTKFWYKRDVETTGDEIPSDILEQAFGKVRDKYTKHQNTWDTADEVESASEDEDGNSDEENPNLPEQEW